MDLLTASNIECNYAAIRVDTAIIISTVIAPSALVNENPSAVDRVVHPRIVTAAPVNDIPSVVVRVVHPRTVIAPAAPVNEIPSAVVRVVHPRTVTAPVLQLQ